MNMISDKALTALLAYAGWLPGSDLVRALTELKMRRATPAGYKFMDMNDAGGASYERILGEPVAYQFKVDAWGGRWNFTSREDYERFIKNPLAGVSIRALCAGDELVSQHGAPYRPKSDWDWDARDIDALDDAFDDALAHAVKLAEETGFKPTGARPAPVTMHNEHYSHGICGEYVFDPKEFELDIRDGKIILSYRMRK